MAEYHFEGGLEEDLEESRFKELTHSIEEEEVLRYHSESCFEEGPIVGYQSSSDQ